MYEENAKLLEEKVNKRAFIRNVKHHLNPDGTVDRAGNLKLWDQVMADFSQISLKEFVPEYDETLDELQQEPYMVFIPGKPGMPTILVSHGGGFFTRTGCEGGNVAYGFHKMGYNTAILSYRLYPYSRLDSLEDIKAAIRYLRRNRNKLNIGEQVVVMGFSAGAMLSANAATLYKCPIERPDLAVISYGAMSYVSFPGPFMGEPNDMEKMLFGNTKEERFKLAPEKQVKVKTPPMFIWQTLSDDGRHGMTLAKALQDAGVDYELHIFDGGVHGLALADGENDLDMKEDHVARWAVLVDEWIRTKLEIK